MSIIKKAAIGSLLAVSLWGLAQEAHYQILAPAPAAERGLLFSHYGLIPNGDDLEIRLDSDLLSDAHAFAARICDIGRLETLQGEWTVKVYLASGDRPAATCEI